MAKNRGKLSPASKARVERLMREHGIRARHKRRSTATTDSTHALPVAPNRLDRHFTPTAPNQGWTADLTYIGTEEGWRYLAVVLDLFNREIVGWSVQPRMTTDIVTDALTMAWLRRKPAPGLLHHSDRGSQYASHAFQQKLAAYGMACSMSRKGNCWDNAPTERFFNSLRTSGCMARATRPARGPGPIRSTILRCFTIGGVATPRSATSRPSSSCRAGSRRSMSG